MLLMGTLKIKYLSFRETDVLSHLAAGHEHLYIAKKLGIAPTTVKDHVSRIKEKMQLSAPNRKINSMLMVTLWQKHKSALASLSPGEYLEVTSAIRNCIRPMRNLTNEEMFI